MSHLQKRGNRYTISFTDHCNRRRRLSTGLSNEQWARRWMDALDDVVECRKARQVMPAHLSNWLDDLPVVVLEQLAGWHIIDSRRVWQSATIKTHIDGWVESMRERELNWLHIKNMEQRVRRICEHAKVKALSDLNPGPLERWLAGQRKLGMSQQTHNHYVAACKAFANWLYLNGRTIEHQLRTMQRVTVREKRKQRRTLTAAQCLRLITETRMRHRIYGLDGPSRSLLYELAMNTGLRRSELRGLTPRHFADLDGEFPRVLLAPDETKNRMGATQPIKRSLARKLARHIEMMSPETLIFSFHRTKAAKMIKSDLEACGIPYTDEQGRDFDFHALRHQFGTLLADAGVHPKTAMELMRHSDINLTMRIYTHSLREAEQQAVEAMPSLDDLDRQQETA